MIDRRRVRDSFGRQAREYDHHASVQKKVQARFLEMLKGESISPRRLLDVGSGTGMLLRSLRTLFGEASAVGLDLAVGMSRKARENLGSDKKAHFLAADAENLPFPESVFDLVVSTSTFQWLGDLKPAFGEAFRVLTPGGLFCFALFAENTLHELKASYRSALAAQGCLEHDRTHEFHSREDVIAAMETAGFTDWRICFQQELDLHDDVPSLLRSLKRIGAGNASPPKGNGLAGKRLMLDMMQRYRSVYGRGSGIPATYGIIYGVCRKGV